jgi:hypothetical protein
VAILSRGGRGGAKVTALGGTGHGGLEPVYLVGMVGTWPKIAVFDVELCDVPGLSETAMPISSGLMLIRQKLRRLSGKGRFD